MTVLFSNFYSGFYAYMYEVTLEESLARPLPSSCPLIALVQCTLGPQSSRVSCRHSLRSSVRFISLTSLVFVHFL